MAPTRAGPRDLKWRVIASTSRAELAARPLYTSSQGSSDWLADSYCNSYYYVTPLFFRIGQARAQTLRPTQTILLLQRP